MGCRSQVCSQLRRSQVRSLSSRATSRALVAAVAAAARRVSARYEQYLERSFPRFYLLYNTFKNGESRVGDPKKWLLKEGFRKVV